MLRPQKNQMQKRGTFIERVNQIGRPLALIAAGCPSGNFWQQINWGRTSRGHTHEILRP